MCNTNMGKFINRETIVSCLQHAHICYSRLIVRNETHSAFLPLFAKVNVIRHTILWIKNWFGTNIWFVDSICCFIIWFSRMSQFQYLTFTRMDKKKVQSKKLWRHQLLLQKIVCAWNRTTMLLVLKSDWTVKKKSADTKMSV